MLWEGAGPERRGRDETKGDPGEALNFLITLHPEIRCLRNRAFKEMWGTRELAPQILGAHSCLSSSFPPGSELPWLLLVLTY